jgi:large subunit ribosomal protein L9
MKLILLDKVGNLGDLGDTVKVRAGYGRNYLVPQGKAVPATKENVAMFEGRRDELEAAANNRLATAQRRAETLAELVLELTANASDEGKLFGSIGPREIADAATEKGFALEKAEVVMGEGPIRLVGEYDVLVHLHADVEITIKVMVNPETP